MGSRYKGETNSMHVKAVTSLLAGLLLLHLVFLASPTHAQSIDDLKKGVVKITAKADGNTRIGTGFVVRIEKDAAYIVTAAHVIEGAPKVDVEFYTDQNRVYSTRIIGQESGDARGLAVLLVEKTVPPETNVLRFSQGVDVKAGDALTMIGFPRIAGVPWAVTKGEVVGRKAKTLVFSGAVDEGSSGGPVIKDTQIIGVVTEMTGQFAYATPALIATYVLEGYGVKFGVHLRARPATLKRADLPLIVADARVFQHSFEVREVERECVVIDRSTGLMWQQQGSTKDMTHEEAVGYVSRLNSVRFAGFENWRLPTSEELVTLLQNKGENQGLFISPVFDPHRFVLWTDDPVFDGRYSQGRDQYGHNFYAIVHFKQGSEGWEPDNRYNSVRAVRSIDELLGPTKKVSESEPSACGGYSTMSLLPDRVAGGIQQKNPIREIPDKDGVPMVLIPAGTFWMGTLQGEGHDDEYPRHQVDLDAFYMEKFEVSVARYANFLKQTGRTVDALEMDLVGTKKYADIPMFDVEWKDADQYCRWAGKRLPTEAEWEKAARGTDERQYPWGNQSPTSKRAHFGGSPELSRVRKDWFERAKESLQSVDRFEEGKSPYGLRQMAGNVREWTADWYGWDYYEHSPIRNPKGPSHGEFHVVRGGSWMLESALQRSADRGVRRGIEGDNGLFDVGFRCAQDAPK